MYDGTRYVAPREGGRINVADEHVSAINAVSGNGDAGLLTAGFREFTRSKKPGRVCTRCGFLAYGWSMTCPRSWCGAPTEPERS